jgi:hypothetical protein
MKAKKPHHFIKLNAETKADMHMWLYFLESFNGKTYFPKSSWTDSDVSWFSYFEVDLSKLLVLTRLEQTPETLCPLVYIYLIQFRSLARKNEPIAPKNTPHNPLQQTRRYSWKSRNSKFADVKIKTCYEFNAYFCPIYNAK